MTAEQSWEHWENQRLYGERVVEVAEKNLGKVALTNQIELDVGEPVEYEDSET